MSLKSLIVPNIAARMMGPEAEKARREKAERARRAAGSPHCVGYFHQVDDPYSYLAAQALKRFAAHYDIVIEPFLVSGPPAWATPERDMLTAYARLDSARLAQKAGLSFVDSGADLDRAQVAQGERVIAAHTDGQAFLDAAIGVGAQLWSGGAIAGEGASVESAAARKQAGDRAREAQGHFMSAMIFYGDEWYWGVDRLHYLAARLTALGARQNTTMDDTVFQPPACPQSHGRGAAPIEYFLSFRSPYTYIAAERIKALADAYGVELKLRFVLPMVMRGMAVPPVKGRYFSLDTAREARRINVPFGRICDPLGRPVERGYSLLSWARAQGRGYEYCLSFMRGVWSQGIDAGETSGMKRIVESAGLDWAQAQPHLDGDAWRAEAEANRLDMVRQGLWGVPCFRVGDVAVWGQDRLWVIEEALSGGAA
jgi:2-hydroxychromene-2-carboxylate isomerase